MESKGNLEFDFVFSNSSEVTRTSIVKNKQGYIPLRSAVFIYICIKCLFEVYTIKVPFLLISQYFNKKSIIDISNLLLNGFLV